MRLFGDAFSEAIVRSERRRSYMAFWRASSFSIALTVSSFAVAAALSPANDSAFFAVAGTAAGLGGVVFGGCGFGEGPRKYSSLYSHLGTTSMYLLSGYQRKPSHICSVLVVVVCVV